MQPGVCDIQITNRPIPLRGRSLSGKFMPVYKQDRGAQGNKFLSALIQINETIDAFLGRRPIVNQNDGAQRVIPMIVTDAPLICMECKDGRVTVRRNYPWLVLLNDKEKIGRPYYGLGTHDYIYVVNSSHLKEFLLAMDLHFQSKAVNYPENLIEQIAEFEI